MEKLFVIHYGKNASWKIGTPMPNKLAEKQAKILTLNGYNVRVVPYEHQLQSQ